MFRLPKRTFLKLAGLAIAERLVPPWVRAAPADVAQSDRKLVVVTFGGGCRYQETFSSDGLRNIPRLARLKAEGRFFSNW